jgi:hypothetical protein
MRTRFKTLTVGLVLATAAMAGCSSTTGSSGAVQNAATASASSAASAAASSVASTAPAPSPEPVTPTAEPTEAQASPIASPTDSLPLLGGTSSKTCNTGLPYACGQTGPGGGIVFYAVSKAFSLSNGYTTAACGSNNCHFMEVQTGQRQTMPWCVGPGATMKIEPGTGEVIGTGYSNTQTMATLGGYCSSGAANTAIASTSGGYTDWFVPSDQEALQLQEMLRKKVIKLPYLVDTCWTSSQYREKTAYFTQLTYDWGHGTGAKKYLYEVCMVRAF